MTQYPNQPTGGYESHTPATGIKTPKTKWIVQLIISAVTMLLCNQLAVVALVLSIIGLVKVDNDLPGAQKFYKWGWIAYIIAWAIWLILMIVLFATGALSAVFSSSSSVS